MNIAQKLEMYISLRNQILSSPETMTPAETKRYYTLQNELFKNN